MPKDFIYCLHHVLSKFNWKHKLSTKTYKGKFVFALLIESFLITACAFWLRARECGADHLSLVTSLAVRKWPWHVVESPLQDAIEGGLLWKRQISVYRASSIFTTSFLLSLSHQAAIHVKSIAAIFCLDGRIRTHVNEFHLHLQGWSPVHLCGGQAPGLQCPARGLACSEAPGQAGHTDKEQQMTSYKHTLSVSLLFKCAHTPAETWILPLPLQSSPTAWSRTSRWIAL